MFTIELGKIFLETYNQKMGVNLTAEEMFDLVAKIAFPDGKKSMLVWLNTKFSNPSVKDPFEEKLNGFKEKLKENSGIETSLNVYGRCACLDKKINTTEPLYCDNLSFTEEERFLSFVGSLFLIMVNGFNVGVYNKNIIWKLWKSINEYRIFLDTNDDIKGNQLATWNAQYLCAKGNICNVQTTGGKIKTFDSILGLLELLYEYDVHKNSKNWGIPMSIAGFGQTNKSAGWIIIEKEIFDEGEIIYNLLNKEGLDEQDNMTVEVYEKFIRRSWEPYLENGAISSNMFNPDIANSKANKEEKLQIKNFIFKHMKNYLNTDEVRIADQVIDFVKKALSSENFKKSLKSEMSAIKESKTFMELINNILIIRNKTGLDDGGILKDAIKSTTIDHANVLKTYILCDTIFNK